MTLLELPTGNFRESCTPVLETERLLLRAPTLEDAKTIAKLANDRRIAENTARIPHPYTVADAKEYVAWAKETRAETAFLVTSLDDDAIIGACGVGHVEGENPEIGYWIGARYWGEGFATEAARAVIDYAFERFEFDALHSSARVTNPASRRVLEKCGFQWTGAGLGRVRALGSSVPIDRFRLDRGLWASLKSWGKVKRVV
jgi:RimJ/RimL family protein N-acetyltransferase